MYFEALNIIGMLWSVSCYVHPLQLCEVSRGVEPSQIKMTRNSSRTQPLAFSKTLPILLFIIVLLLLIIFFPQLLIIVLFTLILL